MIKPSLFDVYITKLSPTEMTIQMRNRRKFTHYFAGKQFVFQGMTHGKYWRKVQAQLYRESLTRMDTNVIAILLELK